MRKRLLCSCSAAALQFLAGGCAEKAAPKPAPVIMTTPPAAQGTPTVPREKLANTIDPICDMDLEEQVRFTVKHDGKEYGFCASYCAEEFQKDPKKFIEKLNAAQKTH